LVPTSGTPPFIHTWGVLKGLNNKIIEYDLDYKDPRITVTV
jgi:hypothetical protein